MVAGWQGGRVAVCPGGWMASDRTNDINNTIIHIIHLINNIMKHPFWWNDTIVPSQLPNKTKAKIVTTRLIYSTVRFICFLDIIKKYQKGCANPFVSIPNWAGGEGGPLDWINKLRENMAPP